MSKYMIRKPEFLKGAEEARHFPNTAVVVSVVLMIFLAWLIAGVIMTIAYASLAAGDIVNGNSDMASAAQSVLVVLLLSEGLLAVFTIIYVRAIEKRPLRTIGFVKRGFVPKYALGFGIGLVLICLNALSALIMNPVSFTGIKPAVFVALVMFMIQGAGEEVLFRGYMMSALLRRGGVMWALTVSTVLFGLFHIFNGNDVLQLSSVVLLGAVLGVYMLREGSIWGAMGMHAAWNFFLVSLVKLPIGSYDIGYSFLDVTRPESEDIILTLIPISALLAMLALLLFVGKNRLVVRKTEEQMLLSKALSIAKKTVSDRGMLIYAKRVSELAQSTEGKTAALLYYAISYGASTEYIRQVFGEDMFSAADALTIRSGESADDYWRRVAKYPASVSAKHAEIKLEEIKRPKNNTNNSYLSSAGGRVMCPMMCWSITEDKCLRLAHITDGEAPAEGEEYTSALYHEICRGCNQRWTKSHRAFWNDKPKDYSF